MNQLSPTCYVMDSQTHKVVYQAKNLCQARGYADRRSRGSIIAISAERFASEYNYQICLIDGTSGQVIAHGPIVDITAGCEALDGARIVLLPVPGTLKVGVTE